MIKSFFNLLTEQILGETHQRFNKNRLIMELIIMELTMFIND